MNTATYSHADSNAQLDMSSSHSDSRSLSKNVSGLDLAALVAAVVMMLGPLAMAPAYGDGGNSGTPVASSQSAQPASDAGRTASTPSTTSGKTTPAVNDTRPTAPPAPVIIDQTPATTPPVTAR